jgi:hypothetical protein
MHPLSTRREHAQHGRADPPPTWTQWHNPQLAHPPLPHRHTLHAHCTRPAHSAQRLKSPRESHGCEGNAHEDDDSQHEAAAQPLACSLLELLCALQVHRARLHELDAARHLAKQSMGGQGGRGAGAAWAGWVGGGEGGQAALVLRYGRDGLTCWV